MAVDPSIPPSSNSPVNPPDDSDHRLLLDYAARPLSTKRLGNFSLSGTGLNPILVYGTALGFLLCWVLGAYFLAVAGPWVGIPLCLVIIGTGYFVSTRQQRRELLENMGCCPNCGYDLRASRERCPECGQPIPSSIERRRRWAEKKDTIGLPANPATQSPNMISRPVVPRPSLPPIPLDEPETPGGGERE